jgi:predicted O-methyltransferase YrrM
MVNVFACLVHEAPDCVADLVANLRRLDPGSEILLYDGSSRGDLLEGRDHEAHVHPLARPQRYARIHGFALDCMAWTVEHTDAEAMTIVDSDQLLVRPGYSAALATALRARPRAGMFCDDPARQPPDTPRGTPRAAYAELARWRPFLERFPAGERAFGHWTFWPSTVFSRAACRALPELVATDVQLQALLAGTRIWGTEEVVLPMLVAALGLELASGPGSRELARYGREVTVEEVDHASPGVFWAHPVPRRVDHPVRRRLRGPRVIEQVRPVEGWLAEDEADALVDLTARALCEHRGAALVEVGSFCGRSTVAIAGALRSAHGAAVLDAIDPHEGTLPRFRENLRQAGVESLVRVHVARSFELAWQRPIGLLFVDALHDYESVARDFRHFERFLRPGAYVAFHDYSPRWPGVVRFVDELTARGYEPHRLAGTLAVLRAGAATTPFVSCVMPTGGRPQFVTRAVAVFLAQDHPRRELIVVDDGPDPADVPRDPRVRVLRLNRRATIGAKRNLACEHAAGDVIAHWDDDDWYAPWRLSAQLARLDRDEADVCGLSTLLYLEPAAGRGWRYRWPPGARAWLHDATLLYRRDTWRAEPQPESDHGLDCRWLWEGRAKRMTALEDERAYVGFIHPGNTSPKDTSGPLWRPYPAERIEALLSGAR